MNYDNKFLCENLVKTTGLSGDGVNAAANGTAIDKNELLKAGGPFNTAALQVEVETINGSPSATSLTFVIEESADNSTWTEVTGSEKIQSDSLVITATGVYHLPFRVPSTKQYFRPKLKTVSFTGGTSPSADIRAFVVLSEPRQV